MAAIYSESALTDDATASLEALKGERYIATKEFNVLPDQDAEFEKEWATRATALAPLEGFRFFSLFKRLGPAGESGESNYLSMTVWENKNAFEAFGADGEEESIAGVAGKPVTASYEGLIPEVGASFTPEKRAESDDGDQITSDIFAGINRFSIKAGKETEFEQKWATRDAQMSIIPGFVSFYLLRREASEADDGNNYSVISIWKSGKDFEDWRSTEGFAAAFARTGGVDAAYAASAYNGPPNATGYAGKLTVVSPLGP